MASKTEVEEFQRRIARLEELLESLETIAEPTVRLHIKEVVRTLLDVHAEAIARILTCLRVSRETGPSILDALGQDELVGIVLLLYGQHPLTLRQRVQQALERVNAWMHAKGGRVELVTLAGEVVHLSLQGSLRHDPSWTMTVRPAIEEMIYEKAPDVTEIVIADESGQAILFSAKRFPLPLVAH